jgi:Kef-type K+ transport system membrane component KefB/Trk K+ transport system NAD-binding subunit
MRILKQPLIIGYILSGILTGPYFLNLIQDSQIISAFSEMGIAFLLFIVGLHLSPRVIKEVGKVALITGIGQIVFTAIIGYFVGLWLGFPPLTAIYIAIALTFSSTIIILKLITDKDALDKLYGKISVGFLLVQDFVAIIILIVISSIASGTNASAGSVFISTLLKGIGILVVLVPFSFFVLKRLGKFLSQSQEFLFLFSLAWGFGVTLLFLYSGFSIEVGALLAGILLSLAPYSYEISSKLKPLRDFFLLSFFLILGSQMVFADLGSLIVPTIVFTILVVIGNPLIVMFLMGRLHYARKTSFMAGLTVAQIGEFSLIFMAMGVRVGHVSQEILSFITLICLFTIFGCTYLIMYADQIYKVFYKSLAIFERKNVKEKDIILKEYDYILLGYNRIGFSIIKTLAQISKKVLVVDYNPETVALLKRKGIDAMYGDVEDSEFLEDLQIFKSKMIVSTVPEKETNLTIIDVLKRNKSQALTLLTSRQISDALELYEAGADYVILPHFLGGEYTSKLIETAKNDKKVYAKEKLREIKILKERLKEGQEHPKVEKEKK